MLLVSGGGSNRTFERGAPVHTNWIAGRRVLLAMPKPARETARKHHYVPEMYLKGFAGRNGRLFVVDAERRRLQSNRWRGRIHIYKPSSRSRTMLLAARSLSRQFVQRVFTQA